ncbi:MAG: serine/threonine-protein kinase [Acidobacteriota bacterium]
MSSEPTQDLEQERRVFALLAEVGELGPEERERALDECDDPALATVVRRMLSAHGSISGFLDTPAPAAFPPTWVGKSIGPYEVLELLGEGGMGMVFRAAQTEPVQREVALKILRLTRLSQEVKVRFEAERQAMARLDHPNIGRILEAGTTENGLPYFAMELIDGDKITTYCDQAELPIEERLRLFRDVCRGTHHAHLKLLLHRDIKPSNVLVTEFDGRPIPKLIDFGIAKGLDEPLAAATMATGDRFLGTPAYMSPEALESGRDVDARSDVFGLGVLLYRLLTGTLPWPAPENDPLQMMKQRLERDADRPSTQITSLESDRRAQIASRRSLDPQKLAQKLRGDLDSIVMKAIEQDPGRRYASAAELADDIERHLADEPIRARPLTGRLLLSKLVRRHRTVVVAAVAVLLALVLGAVGTVAGLLQAREAERRAVAEAEAAVDARDQADEVSRFLVGLFRRSSTHSPNADKAPGETTALELVARGAELSEKDLQNRPVVRARIAHEVGKIYKNLGEFDQARSSFRSSIATQETLDPRPLTLIAGNYLELAQIEHRLANWTESKELLDQTLALVADLTSSPAISLRGNALNLLSRLRRAEGDYEGAEQAIQEAIRIYELQDDGGRDIAWGRATLGTVYFSRQRWADAENQWRQAIELLEPVLDQGNPILTQLYNNLGAAIASQDRLEDAAPMFERAEHHQRARLGDEHHELADTLNNLGVLNQQLERLERAEAIHRKALAIRERALGADHPKTAWSLDNLARTVEDLGRPDEARSLQERALKIREKKLGAEHLDLARSLGHLSRLLVLDGEHRLAVRYADRAYRIRVTQLDPGHREIGLSAVDLGAALWHLERRDEARQRFEEASKLFAAGGESMQDEIAETKERLAALGIS